MARVRNLPTRYADLGRLRPGDVDDSGNKPKPRALGEWRVTSRNEGRLNIFAGMYGGTPHPWEGHDGEYELYTESSVLDVLLPVDSLSTTYEKWGSGGNQRRCDGEICTVPVQDPEGGHLDQVPCVCAERNWVVGEHADACVLTARLGVIIPEVPGVGIWTLTTGSQYAAMELPGQVDTIDALRMGIRTPLPCKLSLEYREKKYPWEKFTRKFYVPILEIGQSIAEIQQAMGAASRGPSIAPVRPSGELPPGTPPAAPGPPAGLPPEGHTYSKAELEAMCLEHGVQTGTVTAMTKRLMDAGKL